MVISSLFKAFCTLLDWRCHCTALAEESSEFGGAKRGIKILRAIDHGIGLMVGWCFGP